MKKFLVFNLIIFLAIFGILSAKAQSKFANAIKTCESYSNDGAVKHNGETFNILITLNKAKGNKCIYREKIYQQKDYQMLTCEFNQNQMDFISDSMSRFNKEFANEIAKNNIFEAKLTTNAEVFQRYLVDQDICKISYSKK